MFSSLSLAILGFLLGVRHAVDPDHVVAVGTIAARAHSFRRAAGIGVLWGLGHTVTILAVGGAIIALRIAISPRVGLAMEFAVAIMLIVLGVLNLLSAHRGAAPEPSSARPVVVGMVHGLAGSAAVVLVVVATVSNPVWSLAYLLLFGLGTVAGMVLVTAAIAVPASLAIARLSVARRWLTAASGVVSVVFGVLLAHALSGPNGIFSDFPVWTPR